MRPTTLFIILTAILSASLISCSHIPNELKTAELIMEEHPDSALHILQKISPEKYSSDANRAMYSLLLFKALDKNDMPLQPDSLLDFSIDYYTKQDDKIQLGNCYLYKGRLYVNTKEYDKATTEFVKSIDICKGSSNQDILGRVYSNLGEISFIQGEYIEARNKYKLAAALFLKASNTKSAYSELMNIGHTYICEKNYKVARLYFKKVFTLSNDSSMRGSSLHDIGITYNKSNKLDSALYYYRQSLLYPIVNPNKSIRYLSVADAMFNKKQYDSSTIFVIEALKHPANYFTRRECYRILVNVSYLKGDIKSMNRYMAKYQLYVDSIRVIESQTKATVIEHQHNSRAESATAKRNLTISTLLFIALIALITIISVYFYQRSRSRKLEIKNYKQELSNKQVFVSQSASNKIKELKLIATSTRKNISPADRIKFVRELYNNVLHLDNWDDFSSDMNHTFNNIIDKLQTEHPALNRKEICWCCLHLLDISSTDRILLLETTTEGLYKLKQRISQKLNLKNTKELDSYLKNMVTNKI